MRGFIRFLNRFSIRSRLLIASTGILIAGFVVLSLVAGRQIARATRVDYETRLLNTLNLVTSSLRPYIEDETGLTAETAEIIEELELEIGGEISVLFWNNERPDDDHHDADERRERGGERPVEIEAALRDNIMVVQRTDTLGNPMLFTATKITDEDEHEREDHPTLIQVGLPLTQLNGIIIQRWLMLGVVLLGVAALSATISLSVSQSIIQSLDSLRDAALRLSDGDLDYRAPVIAEDEIGAVASAFNIMATQVQSMLEEQRAFASNTSHELRTPLTTIRLRSEAIRYEDTLAQEVKDQYIIEIDNEVKRLSSLVEDLTMLSRLDAGRAELGSSEIDTSRFIMSMQRQFAPRLTEKNITLTVNQPNDMLPVFISLNHLTIIFRNLLDNAIKYTPTDGKITWVIEKENGGIAHTITDTGQGIDAENLQRVFERFYRADKAHSRGVPGTGLGLPLVRSIVQAYGGHIAVTSNGLQQGTTVKVFLPQEPVKSDD